MHKPAGFNLQEQSNQEKKSCISICNICIYDIKRLKIAQPSMTISFLSIFLSGLCTPKQQTFWTGEKT